MLSSHALQEKKAHPLVCVSPCSVFQPEVPAHNLESFLDLLSHMVLRPLFQLGGVEKLKQQVITSKIESPDPVELAKEKLRSLIFGEHPYGKPNYGELQSIANIHS